MDERIGKGLTLLQPETTTNNKAVKVLEGFYRELRPHLEDRGMAMVTYSRSRMRVEVDLYWGEKKSQYCLRDIELGEIGELTNGVVHDHNPLLKSIEARVAFFPRQVRGYLFQGPDEVSTMVLIFASQELGSLREYVEGNLELCRLRLANAMLEDSLSRKNLELALLQQTGEILSSSVKREGILKSILKALEKLLVFDALGIFILKEQGGEVEQIFSTGYEGGKCQCDLEQKAGSGLVGWVAKTGEPVIVPDVRNDPRYVKAREETLSEMVVPLLSGGEVIGVFNIESNRLDSFTPADLEMVTAFTNQAALSIVRAKLFEEALLKTKMEDQLEIAREIQGSFLPKSAPKYAGYDIDGINISSEQVGGDYFDFIPIVDHQLGLAIADVAGKGIPAALIMAAFRASLIAEIRNNYAIRAIMRKVNNLICESVEKGSFVTAVYGVLDVRNRILTFSNAGHNPPFILRRNGDVEVLTDGGLTLGITPNIEYQARPVYFAGGEILVLYTDGVTDAENDKSEHFGSERLVELVKRNKDLLAHEIRETIVQEIYEFKAPDKQLDDLTLVVVKAL